MMKIKRENLAKSRVRLNIEVPKTEIKAFFDRAYEKLAPTVNIKGFRAGKAPKLMVIEAVGQNRYNSEALNLALAQTYFVAAKQEKIIPITQPAVAIKQFSQDQDFIFQAEVDVLPKIELGDYEKIRVKYKKQVFTATKEEVDKIITRLRYQSAQFNLVDREAKKGDRVEIEFEGFEKRVRLENFCSKNYPLILGEGVLLPGFEEKIIGAKKGQEKEFNLKVKDKRIDFKVKVLDVKEVKLPELNTDFAKKFGHDNMDNLIKAVSENIVKEKEMRDKNQLEGQILEKLSEKIKAEIPESLIEQEIARKIMELQQRMGPGFNDFIEKSGKKMEDIRKELRPQAEKSVKIGLALGEAAKDLSFTKDKPKTEEEQKLVVRKTIDKLVELATK